MLNITLPIYGNILHSHIGNIRFLTLKLELCLIKITYYLLLIRHSQIQYLENKLEKRLLNKITNLELLTKLEPLSVVEYVILLQVDMKFLLNHFCSTNTQLQTIQIQFLLPTKL